MILYHLSVLVHIVSAMVWVGGMLFLALVVVPATRTMPAPDRADLFGAVGRRFRTVGWVCIGLLLVTGTINSAYRGVTWENLFSAELWQSPFGRTLALKLAIVVVMLGLSLYHDFVVGPRSVRLQQAAASADRKPNAGGGPSPTRTLAPDVLTEAQRLRKRASMIGRLEAALALLVVLLAIMLVRGVPSLF